MQNFAPLGASTTSITAQTTTNNVVLAQAGNNDIRIYNAGSVDVFVEVGVSGVAATVPSGATPGSMPIAPGTVEAFSVGGPATHIAAITASSTATIYITVGRGI